MEQSVLLLYLSWNAVSVICYLTKIDSANHYSYNWYAWFRRIDCIFWQFWQPMCWLISFVCTPIWVKLNQTCSLHENWSDRTEYCRYSRFLGIFFFKRLGGQQLYHQIYRKMICLATNCYLEKRKKNLLLLILNF